MMAPARHLMRPWAVTLGGGLALAALALAACATGTTTAQTTPTQPPVACGAHYGAAYQATLPDASYPQTMVYAQVPLPPQTRTYDDDATGLRGRRMCSAGTTASISTFMTMHLTQLGWQLATSPSTCGVAAIPNYGQPQCWQNGKYHLFMGINSNTDWLLAWVDPAFLQ